MQLTNIARDVVEDKKRNRSYINHDFMSIQETIKIADSFYDSSFPSIKAIPLGLRFSIVVARRIYRKIGYNILKYKNIENYNNAGKVYVSNLSKLVETFLSLFDLIKLIFNDLTNVTRSNEHFLISEEIDLNERI